MDDSEGPDASGTAVPPTGQRAPRGPYAGTAVRREEILRAATHAFADHGFAGASLRDIAARAGITHAGLLHHFKGKEDLLVAVLRHRDEDESARAAKRRTAVRDGADGTPPFLAQLLREHQQDPVSMRFWAEVTASATSRGHPAHDYVVARYARVRAAFGRYLLDRSSGGAGLGMEPEHAGAVLAAVVDGLQVQWLLDRELPIVELVSGFLRLVVDDTDRSVSTVGGRHPARTGTSGGGAPSGRGAESALRLRILQHATRLFASRGYDATSVADLAAAADCSKAVVLYHFPGKSAILETALAPLIEELSQAAADLRTLPAQRRTETAVGRLTDLVVSHRSLVALIPQLQSPSIGGTAAQPLLQVLSGLRDLLAPPEDPVSASVLSMGLLGIAAFCGEPGGVDDETLREGVRRILAGVLAN